MENELKENIERVKNCAFRAYESQTRNYKQKLLYNLLAAVKSKDRSKFMNLLETNLNGAIEGEEQLSFAKKIMEEYEEIQGPRFETYAYAIIAGILASKDQIRWNKPLEADENE